MSHTVRPTGESAKDVSAEPDEFVPWLVPDLEILEEAGVIPAEGDSEDGTIPPG